MENVLKEHAQTVGNLSKQWHEIKSMTSAKAQQIRMLTDKSTLNNDEVNFLKEAKLFYKELVKTKRNLKRVRAVLLN